MGIVPIVVVVVVVAWGGGSIRLLLIITLKSVQIQLTQYQPRLAQSKVPSFPQRYKAQVPVETSGHCNLALDQLPSHK